ncbi:MAG: hypothetical protein IJ804_00290, partial [Prevotella sp.]|nr:hypothetical protein [Prevotella sp.]
ESHGNLTITGCRSSIAISSSVSGDGTHGGLVSTLSGAGNIIIIEGCLFDGSFATTAGTNNCGGFVGWPVYNRPVIKNSLMIPNSVDAGMLNNTFARWHSTYEPTIDNCYYVAADNMPANQGLGYSFTSAPVNFGTAGEAYTTSGITPYTNGLLYDGRYYMTPEAISLANTGTNDVDAIVGYVADVTLQGRTLYNDGKWNTLCLPFSLSAAQIAANANFAGATLMTMDVTEKNGFDATDGTLYLWFKKATEIEAGVPYLVKWEKAADYEGNEASYDISNPVFQGVTISNSTVQTVESETTGLETVQMVGTYSPVSVTADDKSILFLGDANTLYYSTVDRQIRSCRAYFSVPYIKNNAGAKARAFALSFDEEETTGIKLIDNLTIYDLPFDADGWYSLDGRKLSGKPIQRGMYINKGKKILVK